VLYRGDGGVLEAQHTCGKTQFAQATELVLQSRLKLYCGCSGEGLK